VDDLVYEWGKSVVTPLQYTVGKVPTTSNNNKGCGVGFFRKIAENIRKYRVPRVGGDRSSWQKGWGRDHRGLKLL